MRSLYLSALLVLVTGCAFQKTIASGGWAGAGSSFHFERSEAVAWGFEVKDSDLLLTRAGVTMALVGGVPEEGVRYALHSVAPPTLDFLLVDGMVARWRDLTVEVGGRTNTFGDAARIDVTAR